MKLLVVLGVWLIEFIIATNAGVSMNNPFYCYMTDPIRPSTLMHGDWTAYEAIRRFNLPTVNPAISSGTPSRFWYIGRDGGRLPGAANMQLYIDLAASSLQADIVANYNAGMTTLCREDFEAIRNWTIPSSFEVENALLATRGSVITMKNIATSYQQHFPNILSEVYSPNRFHFRHNSLVRTNTTIRAFASGLFGESGSENVIYEDIPNNDWLLRPFDLCQEYLDEWAAFGNSVALAFRSGPEIDEVVTEVNRKLGFQGSYQLSYDTIYLLKSLCTIETSSGFPKSNSPIGPDVPWCAVFSVAHTAVMEYYEELYRFHSAGYGFPNQRLFENLHCGLIQDLLTYMQSDNSTEPMARIFVNSAYIQTMLVVLGAFKDTFPMHQHNYAQQSGRQWRASIMSPIATHLVVVRYDHDDGDHD